MIFVDVDVDAILSPASDLVDSSRYVKTSIKVDMISKCHRVERHFSATSNRRSFLQ